jgi:cytochrome c oxidase subunit II
MRELNLHAVLMLICMVIFVASFAALLLAAWWHHRAAKSAGGNFHSDLWVEISWTVMPCLIVLVLVWPTVKTFWGA